MRTILLDGDIEAYRIATTNEVAIDWGDGIATRSTDLDKAKEELDRSIARITKMLGADRVIVCLTDSQNFRKEVLPSYKANRKGVLKPALLAELRKYLHESQEVFQRPYLEADDVMGILSTMGNNKLITGERIIVSIDKDMRSVPGKLFNPSKVDQGVIEISQHEADYLHMLQTLTGDPTDGYKGLPGVGLKKAKAILKPGFLMWAMVVEAFEKRGLTEADALVQARVARICRAEDYDFINKRVILWNPPKDERKAA